MNTEKKRRIGLVVAIELDAVLERYGEAERELTEHGQTVRVYTAGDAELYVLRSGAGEIAAAAAAAWLIARFDPELILNFGVVGGLTEAMGTTELCVVESVIHYDLDTTGWLNLPRGVYPDREGAYLPTTASLREKALAALPGAKSVVCASADKFVDPPEQKAALHEAYGADICDMEAAGIVLTCLRCGVDCLLIKAVSDSLTGGGAEFLTELARVSRLSFDAVDRVIASL